MHLHILGICGTFMGGIAAIARNAGHTVSGCDANVYPPMSTQLADLGIALCAGYEAAQLSTAARSADVFIVGNVVSRGNPLLEAIMNSGRRYVSGPRWLFENVLGDRHVLAVAGTHGKTTTSAMLAHILDRAGLAPSFLIGGVPRDFGISARLTDSRLFVIEADEYDTAFFDKRSKFVHYRPRTAILNNLEFDHADIYPDVGAIQRQFHHLVRTVPASGRIIWNATDPRLRETLDMGCWTPLEAFARAPHSQALWSARQAPGSEDFSRFEVLEGGRPQGTVEWQLIGAHNVDNALAAIAAARHAGVPVPRAIEALGGFRGIARRMQLRGEVRGIRVYDDFAHHPTAIATTLDGLRRRLGAGARIVAVLEARSHTMRMGVHRDTLAPALAGADEVWLYTPPDLGWDAGTVLGAFGARGHAAGDVGTLARELARSVRAGDHVLVMSNGGFGGLHVKVLAELEGR